MAERVFSCRQLVMKNNEKIDYYEEPFRVKNTSTIIILKTGTMMSGVSQVFIPRSRNLLFAKEIWQINDVIVSKEASNVVICESVSMATWVRPDVSEKMSE